VPLLGALGRQCGVQPGPPELPSSTGPERRQVVLSETDVDLPQSERGDPFHIVRSVEVGQGKEYRPHTRVEQPLVAFAVSPNLAGVVSRGEFDSLGAPAEPFDAGPGVVAVATDDGDVEDSDVDLVVGAADIVAVPAQDGRLVADRVEIGAEIAGIAPLGRDAKGTTLAAASDDQR
jgi:hypothetical protein